MSRYHILFILVSGAILASTIAAGEFAGGAGTPEDPYQIATAGQLVAIGQDPNLCDKSFVLTADIDLDPNLPGGRVFREAVIAWPVVSVRSGRRSSPQLAGSFDGAGHAIRRCTIYDQTGGLYGALFHSVGPQGRVRNLHLLEVMVVSGRGEGSGLCAALAGENVGVIANCSATGVIAGDVTGGGLVGQNSGTVIRCRTQCQAFGRTAGGLVGSNTASGRIQLCSADGMVFDYGTGIDIGGLVGMNAGLVQCCSSAGYIFGGRPGGLAGKNTGVIRESYSLASIMDGYQPGGVAGGNAGTILNCYTLGAVAGDGLAGSNMGVIMSSYSTTPCQPVKPATTGGPRKGYSLPLGYSPGIGAVQYVYFLDPNIMGASLEPRLPELYATPLSASQMTQQASFIGFDFLGDANDGTEEHWFMPESGYPVLTWQTERTGLVGTPDIAGLSLEDARTLLELVGIQVAGGDSEYFCIREICYGESTHPECQTLYLSGRAVYLLPGTYVPPDMPVWIVASKGAYDFQDNVGDGTADNPFQIATAGQLDSLYDRPDLWSSHFVLTADIDLSHRIYPRALLASFAGTFNGNGHCIRGLRIRAPAPRFGPLGMLGTITATGVVHDLRLQGARLESGVMAGTLAGQNEGRIERCAAQARWEGTGSQIGGLVGLNTGQIVDSRAEGRVRAGSSIGGLVGDNQGLIQGCCASGIDVYGGFQAGGLVGLNHGSAARIGSCYARGSVRGANRVGGLVGENGSDQPMGPGRVDRGRIRDSYVTCSVVAPGEGGGCIGYAGLLAEQSRCFFLRPADGGGPDNGLGTPLTDAQMREQASFTGWDFENTWTICQGRDYPRLRWEESPCDQ